jgi:hypothetical protein
MPEWSVLRFLASDLRGLEELNKCLTLLALDKPLDTVRHIDCLCSKRAGQRRKSVRQGLSNGEKQTVRQTVFLYKVSYGQR